MDLIEYTTTQKKQLVVKAANYQMIVGQLYKLGLDEILRRSILAHEIPMILAEPHEGVAGCHYAGRDIVQKILCAWL